MNNHMPTNMRFHLYTHPIKQALGVTLVELMVALTIGLIILAGVATLFATSRSTYALEENLARVQESGRFAMEFLAQDIRMAGYSGCSSKMTIGTLDASGDCPPGVVCNLVSSPNAATSFDTDGIKGHRYSGSAGTALTDWTPALPADYFSAGDVKAGNDVIIIQRADTLSTHLVGNLTPNNANIKILTTAALAGTDVIKQDDIMMISDCKGGDIFQVTSNPNSSGGQMNIAHAGGNIQPKLSHIYGNDAEIMKLVSRAYYIGTGASGQPALFRKELIRSGVAPQAQELVEGVETMKFLYGEDTNVTTDYVPNIYRLPGVVANWRNVVSVRVGLLIRTSGKVAQTDNQVFDVAGTTMGPFNDNLRRRAFNSTVRIRTR